MGGCEFIGKCPFFNGHLAGHNLKCARYMVANALRKEKMPPDLLPDQKERAYLCIAEEE